VQMDFDDLLADPFVDPFAKPRSGSPDPWASFSHQSAPPQDPPDDTFSADSYNSVYDEENRSSTPTTESYATGEQGESISHESVTVDPLEAAAINAEEDGPASGPTSPQSPGFRESISVLNPTDHTQTIAEPEPVTPPATETPTSSELRHASTPARSPSPPHRLKSPNPPIAASHSRSSSKVRSPVVSPLERPPASSNIHRSFTGLALGGESIGGWQSEQGSWANDYQPTPSVSNLGSTMDDDDDDDDEPILKSRRIGNDALIGTNPKRNDTGIQPVFSITVDDPQKVGDPIRSFTMYTVHTRTTSPLFQKSSFSVLRRYSDFLWLYETLSVNNPGVVVPPAPEKNPFGRFDDSFVQQRRLALEKCIQKTANHPVLSKDPDLKMFLESDSFALDIKHRKAEIAHERGGLMASIGQTIAGPRFYETDEWFDKQKVYLDSLEAQLRGLVKAIEAVAKQRSDLATATGEFAQTIRELSACDIEKQLAHSLAAMADVGRKAQELQSTQSNQDVVTLMSTVDEYARLINSVRLAFNSRIRTYHAWQNADAEVRRVKQNHERARGQARIPVISLNVLADTERRALDAKQEFDHCSKLIKTEVARFEQERIEDFKDALQVFLDGMISRQKELIGVWENYQQLLLKRLGT